MIGGPRTFSLQFRGSPRILDQDSSLEFFADTSSDASLCFLVPMIRLTPSTLMGSKRPYFIIHNHFLFYIPIRRNNITLQ